MSALALEKYNPQMSEADLAHAILKDNGSPLCFGELMERVMVVKPLNGKDKAHVMAGIHTEINLDGRFVHVGQGVWALKEWVPGRRIVDFGDDEEEQE